MTDTITSRQFSDGISWLFNGDEVVFPYGKRPGSFIGGPTDWGGHVASGQFVFTKKSEWDAYQWNPPQYWALNQFISNGWSGSVTQTTSALSATGYEYIYIAQDARPDINDVRDGNDARLDENHLPDGWSRDFPTDATGTVWYSRRGIGRVSAEHALTTADPAASEKPTWEEIVTASFQQAMSTIEREMLSHQDVWGGSGSAIRSSFLHRRCQYRIRRDAFAARSLDHEQEIRQHLKDSGSAEDAETLKKMISHRDHLSGRYHEIKQWARSMIAKPSAESLASLRALYAMLSEGTDDALWTDARWTPPGKTGVFDDYDDIPDYGEEAPDAPPPFEMRLGFVSETGTTYRYELKMTGGAKVDLTADKGVKFPVNPVSRRQAGTIDFDVEIPRGSGTVEITATASPYGEEVEVSVTRDTPAGESDTMDIGTPAVGGGLVDWSNISVLIPAYLVEGGATAYLRRIVVRRANNAMVLQTASTPSGNPGSAGPQLTSEWEANGTLVINAGDHMLEVKGPAASDSVITDTTEPYFWAPANASEVEAFFDAVAAEDTPPAGTAAFLGG